MPRLYADVDKNCLVIDGQNHRREMTFHLEVYLDGRFLDVVCGVDTENGEIKIPKMDKIEGAKKLARSNNFKSDGKYSIYQVDPARLCVIYRDPETHRCARYGIFRGDVRR